MVLSRDGRWVAFRRPGQAGGVALWDRRDHVVCATIASADPGRMVVLPGGGGIVSLEHVAGAVLLRRFEFGVRAPIWTCRLGREAQGVTGLALAGDADALLLVTHEGLIVRRSVEDGRELGRGPIPPGVAVAFTPGGTRAALWTPTVYFVWDAASGGVHGANSGHLGPVSAAASAPNAAHVASTAGDGLRLWHTETRSSECLLPLQWFTPSSCAGRTVVVGPRRARGWRRSAAVAAQRGRRDAVAAQRRRTHGLLGRRRRVDHHLDPGER